MTIRSELMEICETGAKKSNPGLLSFYIVLAGNDTITGADKATTCTCQLKAPTGYFKLYKK